MKAHLQILTKTKEQITRIYSKNAWTFKDNSVLFVTTTHFANVNNKDVKDVNQRCEARESVLKSNLILIVNFLFPGMKSTIETEWKTSDK